MFERLEEVSHSLAFRLILPLASVLLVCLYIWGSFLIDHKRRAIVESAVEEADALSKVMTLSIHHAILTKSGDDINKAMEKVQKPKGFQKVRRFYKQKQKTFSNGFEAASEEAFSIQSDGCRVCHLKDPPQDVSLKSVDPTKGFIVSTWRGERLLRVFTPVFSEPGCSAASCHAHSPGRKVLGVQETVLSLEDRDDEVDSLKAWLIALFFALFLPFSAVVCVFIAVAVDRPIQRLIRWTRLIGQGKYERKEDRWVSDEIGQLSVAILQMGTQIAEKQDELNRQRNEYQQLFEEVPCLITMQDKDLRLVRYNREFARQFEPKPGAYCFEVYKGRSEKCDPCPVLLTFEDGRSHSSEETGITKEDPICYRIVRTSAIKDPAGEITGVIQMSLDITRMKRLEAEMRKSEEKYRSIFNNIPNPVFILDRRSLKILDCNQCVKDVYGYGKEEILQVSFLNFFEEAEHQNYALELRNSDTLNHARQVTKDGRSIFVNIRVSPYEYMGRPALLVASSDIIRLLMVKQQLIQASKMSTLGEMATGIAHELNQPLSVIKTASSFMLNKSNKGERLKDAVLKAMVEEIDNHVDRASSIITHVREFGRKSEAHKEPVFVNTALQRAFEIFNQQLKLREIEVVKELEENLPLILADSNRLEQVFINLLINARDAIEEKCERLDMAGTTQRIYLRTHLHEGKVRIEVKDTGIGIRKELLDRIFEPFFTTKKMGKGTGLGLSISYGIVQDYQGTLQVETVENEGSSFIIQFPIQVKSDGG